MQRLRIRLGFEENGRGEPVVLFEQGEEQVLDIKLLLAVPARERLRGAQTILEFFRKAVEVHKTTTFPLTA